MSDQPDAQGASGNVAISSNGQVDIEGDGPSMADIMSAYATSEPMPVDDGEADGAENADDAEAVEKVLSEKDNAESPEEETAAEDAKDEPEPPAIDPPKSWSKEAHERWNKLDPDTQKWLLDRDSEDQKAIKRSFNEAAEARKAVEAELAQAKQVRTEYEGKLPALMDALHQASPFADVKTIADVEKMQAEDPFRFQQFQVYQWKMAGVQQELQQAKQRQTAETQTKFTDFVKAESAALNEKMPEFADKDKGPELSKKLVEYLRSDVGLTDQELGSYSAGEKISPLDHRLQVMAVKAMRYDELQKAPPKAIPKPVPQVQKPGTARPAGSQNADNIQNLERLFERTGSVDDAFALQQARDRRRAS